jgi:hypothetical protein
MVLWIPSPRAVEKSKQWLRAAMKKLILPLLAGSLFLSGCANHYVIKLTNGVELVSASKPKLKDNIYHFKDAKGAEHVVSSGRVLEIEPASMARTEKKPKYMPLGKSPHKRHWYFLWLF